MRLTLILCPWKHSQQVADTWKQLQYQNTKDTEYRICTYYSVSQGKGFSHQQSLLLDSRQHIRISLNYGCLKVAFEMKTIFFWELSEDLYEEKKH